MPNPPVTPTPFPTPNPTTYHTVQSPWGSYQVQGGPIPTLAPLPMASPTAMPTMTQMPVMPSPFPMFPPTPMASMSPYGQASQMPQGYNFGQFGPQVSDPRDAGVNPAKARPSPDKSNANFPMGVGLNNPNEPASMTNQYNKAAIDAARPPQTGGAGTTPKTADDGSWYDEKGNKRSKNARIDYAYQNIDGEVGKGFTDRFMQLHGVDPISFYVRGYVNDPKSKGWELPGAQGDDARSYLMNRAAYAATSDAKMLPAAVNEWQQVHGNTPIPQEMWNTWSSIALATGGQGLNAGVGQSQYGVY